jgi:LCP family protein required for cell wall assembly
VSDDPDQASGAGLPPELDPRGRRPSEGVPRRARSSAAGPAVIPPATPLRSRGRRVARVLSWLAVVLSVSVLALTTGGYFLYGHYDRQIARIPGLNIALPGTAQPPAAPQGAENVLLVGSDSRTGAGNASLGKGQVFGQRSDTVILAHLYGGKSSKAQLVSFPRDSYVTIPEWTNPATGRVRAEHQDKLNSAYAEGGPQLLIATIQGLTGIRVDHYVQIDFSGFKSMVDRLGGVEVCLTEPAVDQDAHINLPAGRQTINGTQALGFVRQRHGLEGEDLGRIKRQQRFIGSMIRKVLSAGTLANPLKLNGFLDAATKSINVDSETSAGDLRNLALRLRNFNAGGVVFSTINVSDAGARRPIGGQSASVVLLDDVKNAQLFDDLRSDRAPGAPAPSASATPDAPALTVPPAGVRVRVFNGAGVAGLGRRAAADLTSVGFQVVGVPDNRGSGAAGTVVRYGPDRVDSAQTLAAALPGATTELDPALGRTLEVVVGSSYAGATAVTVAPRTPSPSTGASPTPPPKVVTAAEDVCGA